MFFINSNIFLKRLLYGKYIEARGDRKYNKVVREIKFVYLEREKRNYQVIDIRTA